MMTGEEISAVLHGLKPHVITDLFLACPLHLASGFTPLRANPDADLAVSLLGWPRPVCAAIADRFDGDGRWPDAADKRTDRREEDRRLWRAVFGGEPPARHR